MKRADSASLKAVFDKYASQTIDGEKFMTDVDFLVRYLGLFPEENFNVNSAHLLCGVLDSSKDKVISFSEFQAFEGRLCVPDALYRTAFQLFDTNGNGTVSYGRKKIIFICTKSKKNLRNKILGTKINFAEKYKMFKNYKIEEEVAKLNFRNKNSFRRKSKKWFFRGFFLDEFCQIIRQTTLHEKVPFPFDSEFVKLYFGKKKNRSVTYAEFSQFLHDFHEEYANVAFRARDRDGSGFITANDFGDIMSSIKGHLLTEAVRQNLVAAAHMGHSEGDGKQVSYPFFVAFISLLQNIELIKKIYLNATDGSKTIEITKGK